MSGELAADLYQETQRLAEQLKIWERRAAYLITPGNGESYETAFAKLDLDIDFDEARGLAEHELEQGG